ncbi:MAG: MASE1 domain-containing protein [Alphaproteobacteria bacterium]|nr:MASE1 domain-containing protein [Alphaproteobacteria bacterium]
MKLGADLAFFAAYVAVDWASSISDAGTIGITPWNPSVGVALSWLILHGPSRGLHLFLAIVTTDFIVRPLPGVPLARLLSAGLIAGGYAAAAAALLRRGALDPRIEHLRDLVLLLGVSAAAAALLALANVGQLMVAKLVMPEDFLAISLRQWVGDVIGIAVVTPTVLRARTWRLPAWGSPPTRLAIEGTAAAIAIAAFVWIVFGWEGSDEYKVFYLLFLPVVAIAVRRGLDGACLSLLLTQVGMIVLVQSRGFGSAEVTDFQLLMLSLTVTGLLTGAVVSDRARAERATREFEQLLRERQSELEHLSRISALGEMASMLAHELNQPMTATRAYVRTAQRMLDSTEPPPEERRKALDAIANAVAQVDLAGAIVRNLRDMVRRRAVTREPVDLGELAHQALALVRSQGNPDQVNVAITQQHGAPIVVAERIRIMQVLMNLLRNAFEAVQPDPLGRRRIEVRITPIDGGTGVELSVRDFGPGVPPEVQPNLFASFTTTKSDGLGLGLSICRGIIQAHGGRLWLESTGPEGSDFRFTLPVGSDSIDT